MFNTIHNELITLAAKFAEQRQLSGNKRRFPETIWKKAVVLAPQCSIEEMGQAIVPSAYLKRKMSLITQSDFEMTFVELTMSKQELSPIIKINFESSFVDRMMINGINSIVIAPLLAELLKKGGLLCCK